MKLLGTTNQRRIVPCEEDYNNSEIEKIFEENERRPDQAEVDFTEQISTTVYGLLSACCKQKDTELPADKFGQQCAFLESFLI